MAFIHIIEGLIPFLYGILTMITQYCYFSPIVLAFLSVTFAGLGVRLLKRVISVLGRGH